MRIFTTVVCLFLTMAILHGAQAQDRPRTKVVLLDRIIAVVNDQVITRRDLDERISGVLSRMREQGTPLPPNDVLERQVLERMIQTRVQLQYARDTGLRVDDAALDSTIARALASSLMPRTISGSSRQKSAVMVLSSSGRLMRTCATWSASFRRSGCAVWAPAWWRSACSISTPSR